MKSIFYNHPTSYILQYPSRQDTAGHQAALTKLAQLGNNAWINLDAPMLQTRYLLNVVELHFKISDTVLSIQQTLRNVVTSRNAIENEDEFYQFYLIAQPQSETLYYNITDYIKDCIISDLSIAERLIGRSVLYLYQSSVNDFDLLSESGCNDFIECNLANYINTYGTDTIIGFALEPPSFLNAFDVKPTSIPWGRPLLKHFHDENFQEVERSFPNIRGSYLPSIFYDEYNSSVIRSVYWQELSSQFAETFISGMRDYCHQHNLRLGMKITESSRSLQYELGTLLEQVDCPILDGDESYTPRRFVVEKFICSNSQHVGTVVNQSQSLDQYMDDAILGFNMWISDRMTSNHVDSTQNAVLTILQDRIPIRPILMLSPTQSLWMKPEEKQWNGITKAWSWLCKTVWEMGYDFDIVSEVQLFAARVDRKKGLLKLNGNEYNVVLLPSCLSLHEDTVKCLTNFTKSKGKFILNAPVPYLINGKIGLEPYLLERLIYGKRTTILDGPENERESDLRKHLNKLISPTISVFVGDRNQRSVTVKILHRSHDGFQSYLLFNTENKSIDTLIEMTVFAEKIEEIQFETGKKLSSEFWHANGKTYMNCTFKPRQGRLFTVY